MADVPDALTVRRNRDLAGRRDLFVRRTGLVVLGAFLVAGAANAFGQRPSRSSESSAKADVEVYAAKRVRGGLYYEARFTVRAREELRDAQLVLDSGWGEGITINTVEPSPVGEASRDGRLAFDLGHVPAGEKYVLFLQLQVNPTNVGRREQDVELYDGDELLVHIDRTVTVFP